MRAITGLELAAELYRRQASELASVLTLALTNPKKDSGAIPLRIGINGDLMGGMRAPVELGKRRMDIAYVNPAAIVNMAYKGKGFYKEKMQLRVLAPFPSWDRIAFAVSKDLEVRSLFDIARRKIPLRVSTRFSGVDNTTYYTLSTIMSLYGLSFEKIKRWGGKVQECARPSTPQRRNGIRQRTLNAIFDEGISSVGSWLDEALENGFEVIPLDPQIVKKLEAMGYHGATLPKARYPQLKQDLLSIDFSGWSLVTHRWMPNGIAYSACAAIETRKDWIPVDDDEPLNMAKYCKNTDAGPLDIPLHPGALKYYKDKGYL